MPAAFRHASFVLHGLDPVPDRGSMRRWILKGNDTICPINRRLRAIN
jgi:hypothetical protein